MGEMRNSLKILVGKPEGRSPLRRPSHRWEDNIELDLKEIGFEGEDWINLARNKDLWRAIVNTIINLRAT
jgi:hypothetical protein